MRAKCPANGVVVLLWLGSFLSARTRTVCTHTCAYIGLCVHTLFDAHTLIAHPHTLHTQTHSTPTHTVHLPLLYLRRTLIPTSFYRRLLFGNRLHRLHLDFHRAGRGPLHPNAYFAYIAHMVDVPCDDTSCARATVGEFDNSIFVPDVEFVIDLRRLVHRNPPHRCRVCP